MLQVRRRPAGAPVVLVLLATLAACVTAPPGGPPARQGDSDLARQGDPDRTQWDLDWADGAVFYEVSVPSFADSDGDGVGDLPGLTARLDDLNDGDPETGSDLGVDVLWLLPIFESGSDRGDDVVDYERIAAEYGTEEDLARLLAECHRRGLRVIIDLATNHTSATHPWFVSAAASPRSPRRHWYVWRQEDPGWTQPWGGASPTWHPQGGWFYHGIFGPGSPDLNWHNPEVRGEMARLAGRWIERGVDGLRLGGTRYLVAAGSGALQSDSVATHAYLKQFSAQVRARNPATLLAGDGMADTATTATYYGSRAVIRHGDELPMNLNSPLAAAILAAVEAGDAGPVATALTEMGRLYPAGTLAATFLSRHDQPRTASRLAGDPGRLRLAAAILLTLPGSPSLYYGEEVGLRDGGATAGAPWIAVTPGRETANVMPADEEPGSLRSRYRTLIGLRRSSPALSRGSLRLLSPAVDAGPILAFVRSAGEETVLAVHNLGEEPAIAGPFRLDAAASTELFADAGAGLTMEAGGLKVALPARGSGVWRLGNPTTGGP